MIPLPDSKLITVDDIKKRIETIRRNREALCDIGYRSNHISDFNKRQVKITKLTEREFLLLRRLKLELKQQTECLK